jgi:hypothetical protein
MALGDNELFEAVDRESYPRIAPARDGGVFTRTFNTVVAADKYVVATPIYFDGGASNHVKVWTNGQTVDGFVYPNKVQTSAADEVLGEVMQRGKIHLDDILLTLVVNGGNVNETEANLKTALRNGLVERGLLVQGLDAAH